MPVLKVTGATRPWPWARRRYTTRMAPSCAPKSGATLPPASSASASGLVIVAKDRSRCCRAESWKSEPITSSRRRCNEHNLQNNGFSPDDRIDAGGLQPLQETLGCVSGTAQTTVQTQERTRRVVSPELLG